jgi:lysozyme
VSGKVDPKTYAALRKSYAKAEPELSVSSTGRNLVASFEGYVDHPYRDAVGVWTICYGHTGSDVFSFGSHVSKSRCLKLLQKDLDRFAVAVAHAVTSPTSSEQYNALVSFAYNVGAGALQSSTLLRYHNGRDYRQAADEFPKWKFAGGRVLEGLVRRRAAERSLYLQGTR